MADDYDRPHHHDNYSPTTGLVVIYVDHPCTHDDTCPIVNPVVVVALDDYRRLVVAARDRHPTNHRGGATDPTGRPDSGPGVHDNCPVCSRPS